jgi:hypothetical protein
MLLLLLQANVNRGCARLALSLELWSFRKEALVSVPILIPVLKRNCDEVMLGRQVHSFMSELGLCNLFPQKSHRE